MPHGCAFDDADAVGKDKVRAVDGLPCRRVFPAEFYDFGVWGSDIVCPWAVQEGHALFQCLGHCQVIEAYSKNVYSHETTSMIYKIPAYHNTKIHFCPWFISVPRRIAARQWGRASRRGGKRAICNGWSKIEPPIFFSLAREKKTGRSRSKRKERL